jgi:pimeloyl-ACP methyl ester carboxylesterase
MAPSAKRAVAYVAAGAFSAAGVAFALSHEYTKRIRRSPAPEDPELAVPDEVSHFVVALRDGGESHLIEMGEGPPLVLLHGANLSAEVWSYQLRDLSATYRVIALDLRGHGRSSAGEDDVTISAMATDVAEVMGALGLERAVLVGHSMGGMVSLRLARAHPELLGTRIGAIALVATSGGVGLANPSWGRLASAVSLVAGAGVGIWRPGRTLATADAGYLASRIGFGRAARPAEVVATMAMLRAMDPQVFAKLVSEVLAFDESAPFGDIGVPVAVAVGTSDHLTPPLYARRLAACFKDATLREYPGAGHMLMYERREELDELLRSMSQRAGSP